MEKSRAVDLENTLQKAAEELSDLRVAAVEKEKFVEKCEQHSQDIKVCVLISLFLNLNKIC